MLKKQLARRCVQSVKAVFEYFRDCAILLHTHGNDYVIEDDHELSNEVLVTAPHSYIRLLGQLCEGRLI